MLYYVPIEAYKERYTIQLSALKTGWLERNWINAGVKYHRIDGDIDAVRTINTGVVLDPVQRTRRCFAQVEEILSLAQHGHFRGERDVIYFDDFWHLGIEAIPYTFQQMGIRPKMYSFLYAQSVDEFDFTYSMRRWMRHMEKGIAEFMDGIFVASTVLKDLVTLGGITDDSDKVHTVGLIFDSDEVKTRMPVLSPVRKNQVVYSSRWDKEKNPRLFLEIADLVLEKIPDTTFVVCTGADKLRSNQTELLQCLNNAMRQHPGKIVLKEGLSKKEYYATLAESKIQINTADQDFVSFTLLEASVAGCYPIYPYFRSFPETFQHIPGFMYERGDARHAAKMVAEILSRDDLWTADEVGRREWIHKRFDLTWKRMLAVMNQEYGWTGPFEGGVE